MKHENEKKFIFGSLFVLANRLQMAGDQFDPQVTMKQWFLVAMASQFREPPTLSALAELMGCTRQNVKKLAVLLEKKGFLELRRDGRDARALRVVMTPHCYTYFKGREAAEDELLETLYAGMSQEEIAALHQGMKRLTENLETIEARVQEGFKA